MCSSDLVGPDRIPIPALLATAAVHNYLIRKGLRTSVGLVVESGEPREIHHFACLAGYGAEAVNPYLAFETLLAMQGDLPQPLEDKEIIKRYIKSIDKGLLKVMSKMGISTYQSYCGAQIFDAVGLKQAFVDKYFTGTHTRIEGVGLPEIAEEAVRRHKAAFGDAQIYQSMLDVGGDYAVRVRGEDHVWTANTVSRLISEGRTADAKSVFRQFRDLADATNAGATTRAILSVLEENHKGLAADSTGDLEAMNDLLGPAFDGVRTRRIQTRPPPIATCCARSARRREPPPPQALKVISGLIRATSRTMPASTCEATTGPMGL